MQQAAAGKGSKPMQQARAASKGGKQQQAEAASQCSKQQPAKAASQCSKQQQAKASNASEHYASKRWDRFGRHPGSRGLTNPYRWWRPDDARRAARTFGLTPIALAVGNSGARVRRAS